MSVVLDYAAPEPRRFPWRTVGRAIVAVVGLFGVLLVISSIDVRVHITQVDAVSGSTTGQTRWILGFRSKPVTWTSPLETRLRQSGITWTPVWRTISYSPRNIFGMTTGCHLCVRPPITRLRTYCCNYATAATDEELTYFVQIMQNGTHEQRANLIDDIVQHFAPPGRAPHRNSAASSTQPAR